MHELQLEILSQLTLNSQLRYNRLKPPLLESNHFVYHLRRLISAGLVGKSGLHYGLTPAGQRYADRLSLQPPRGPRIQPKIVTLLACENNRGDWLLYRRKKQPFFGLIGFPYGKIHLEEHISDAALRELKEKTGLTARLKHVGNIYLSVYEEGELISHMLAHVFYGRGPRGELLADSPIGQCFFAPVGDLNQDFMPGFKEVFQAVQAQKPFFLELVLGRGLTSEK